MTTMTTMTAKPRSRLMNSLHLFAGIGGGILADKILGNRIVGAVEIE